MDTTAATPVRGYTATKDDLQKRLRRIEGQVRGLQRMVDGDTYCIDVLTQVAAVTKALQGVALGLLDDHMRHCVAEAVRAGEGEGGGDDKVAEAMGAVGRLLRS
jgi:CsoR family transcriptional regulator, copper-sensing transcriptional repressor